MPAWARDHFWEQTPYGACEFWSFKYKPKCDAGDTIHFLFDGKIVAEAPVWKIEEPGRSACEGTGRFKSGWKVFWLEEDFVDLRGKA